MKPRDAAASAFFRTYVSLAGSCPTMTTARDGALFPAFTNNSVSFLMLDITASATALHPSLIIELRINEKHAIIKKPFSASSLFRIILEGVFDEETA